MEEQKTKQERIDGSLVFDNLEVKEYKTSYRLILPDFFYPAFHKLSRKQLPRFLGYLEVE